MKYSTEPQETKTPFGVLTVKQLFLTSANSLFVKISNSDALLVCKGDQSAPGDIGGMITFVDNFLVYPVKELKVFY